MVSLNATIAIGFSLGPLLTTGKVHVRHHIVVDAADGIGFVQMFTCQTGNEPLVLHLEDEKMQWTSTPDLITIPVEP